MKIPEGCKGCRNECYFKDNGCLSYDKSKKKVIVYKVQPYHHDKKDGIKLKRYSCIQGYGLYKGGMYILDKEE